MQKEKRREKREGTQSCKKMKKMVEALQEREGAVASHTHTHELGIHCRLTQSQMCTHAHREYTTGHIKCMHYTSYTHKRGRQPHTLP